VKSTPEHHPKLINYSRPLFGLALIAGSLFQLIVPVLAAPAPIIKNQATATYENPENPADPANPQDPNRIETVSNIVEIAIQEVAGITVKQQGLTDETGKDITAKAGSTVYFRFDLTNIGNDGTKFFVPNQATITGAGTVQKVQSFDATSKTWKDIPAAGFTSGNIAPAGSLQVRVAVKVADGANGKIAVSLGKTNGTTPNLQNEAQTAVTKNPEDVFTVDNPDGTVGDLDGTPDNGIREAMDTQSVTINAQPQAFATLKKISGNYIATDNSISYGLSFKVADTAPTQAGTIAADLVGTVVPGLGTTPGILISDAVPLGTKLATVTPPTGWVPVYQYGAAIGAIDRADTATWTTTEATSGTLRRVGFFLANGRIAKGTAVTGFTLKLTVLNPLKTTEILNIAQLFGSSPANPNDPTDQTPNPNLPVVDESGDNNPNNFNADGTPGARDPQDPTKPLVTPGIIDRTAPVGDPRNPTTIGQDTKDGDGGEYVATLINPALNILNGPKDRPDALGQAPGTPNDNNNDFSNKSAPVKPGIQTTDKFDPEAVGFFNTVQNTADFPTDIKVIPSIKLDEPLPEGTKVTLKDSKQDQDPGVIFTVRGGKLVPDDTTKPVLVLVQVPGKGNVDYTTIIDLPANTNALKGYPVQLTAFIDLNNDQQPGTEEPMNKTLDRVYAGFIDLYKESRILGADQQPVNDATTKRGEFSKENKLAKPGEYIEYRIKFANVSASIPDGSGSKPLNANNFTIVEDGTTLPNNWATLTDNVPGSVKVDLGVVQLTPNPDDLKVTKYVNTVGTLAPQKSGTFSFIRKVK
jgi:hypothetical protein